MIGNKCPSCGNVGIPGVLKNPNSFYCTCGMVWTQITSKIDLGVRTDKRSEIQNVLERTIVAFTVKNQVENEVRLKARENAIKWILNELMKGPIAGGTLADTPYEIQRYGEFVWEAEQKAVLIRDDVCRICGKRPSKEVHHIRPRHLRGRDHPRNLIGLCLECHDEVHRRIDSGIQKTLEDSLDIKIPKFQTTLDSGVEE